MNACVIYTYIYTNAPPRQNENGGARPPEKYLPFNSTLTRDVPLPVNATTDQLDNLPLSSVSGFKELATPWYADQVLPFDVTIAAANEYGAAASAKLFGVEILNEGFGTSVDDSVLEQQATFVARSVLPLQAVGQRSLSFRHASGSAE